MRFTPTRAAFAVALAFGISVSNSHAVRPEPLAEGANNVKPVWMPLGVSKREVTVVVQLAGESIAEQQGNAGRKLERAEKDQIKAQLRSQQDGVRSIIHAMGGRVVAQYQAAYNGMKVRIAQDAVSNLSALPGVVGVRPLQLQKPNNVRGVDMIGAPAVWEGVQRAGLHGEGVKIAIIDTGIDYTHANFGGPGTAAAYTAAHANETAPADPALFGPDAPRVKGGIDLVGDAYDPEATLADGSPDVAKRTPRPDPNPLDCNGHGSHVAGTAAGSGVTADGKTYAGKYTASTIASNSWNVGPGVAPRAQLYAVRVFGCEGATDVTVDAIEWAVDNDMDVINMSLGSAFGSKDDPSAVASTNAAKAGVIVVTSAGNSGPSQYITGSPGTAAGAISTAAIDPVPTFPGASIGVGAGIDAVNANNAPLPAGSLAVKVLKNADGTTSLGCDPAEYVAAGVTNKIVVTARGTCARVARAVFGQKAGAAAVVMINNAAGFPPFEGTITGNPDTGEQYLVTIPFLGVPPTSAAALTAADGGSSTLTAKLLNNPGFKAFASFSSGGPRTGDSGLKPDITAPGVSIVSTGVGTGNGAATISGTSMASPHVAGVAALTRQAHRSWKVEDIKSAIVNTGAPSKVVAHRIGRGGTGLVQPLSSTTTDVVVRTGSQFDAAVNFGFAELSGNFHATKDIALRNNGNKDAIFNVAVVPQSATSRVHTVTLSRSSVRVGKHDETVSVTLDVPVATAGSSSAFREVAGFIEFTPASAADNGGVALRVPYYFVPRALSSLQTVLGAPSGTPPSRVATVTNSTGPITGSADFYAWGLSAQPVEHEVPGGLTAKSPADVRAIGVQSFPDGSDATVVFAVNTYNRWSNAATNEFDIYVDVDNDGKDDYVVVGADFGAVTTGTSDGRLASFVFSLRSSGSSVLFLASAPSDSSTALLPVMASQLCRATEPCLSSANPRITYHAVSYDLANGGAKELAGSAKFNAWSSSISQGDFLVVAKGASATSTVTVDPAEAARTPALGVMIVTTDNKSGADEAQLLSVPMP